MIEAIRSHSNHTLFGVIAEGVPALLSSFNALVNQVALTIILQVVISIPLFYLHHNLFALGFVIGFIFDKQVSAVVDKVNVVYNAHRTLLERALFYGGGGFLAILTMPTSMVIATLYYSAQWGALLYQESLTRYPRSPSPNSLDEAKFQENDLAKEDLIEIIIDDRDETIPFTKSQENDFAKEELIEIIIEK